MLKSKHMKLYNQRRCNFIIKSFLWSILLYSGMMVALNWDEVRSSVSGKNSHIVISPAFPESVLTVTTNPAPSSINSGHGGIVKGVMAVLRTISGFSGNSR